LLTGVLTGDSFDGFGNPAIFVENFKDVASGSGEE
jgi:hypothetical protein